MFLGWLRRPYLRHPVEVLLLTIHVCGAILVSVGGIVEQTSGIPWGDALPVLGIIISALCYDSLNELSLKWDRST